MPRNPVRLGSPRPAAASRLWVNVAAALLALPALLPGIGCGPGSPSGSGEGALEQAPLLTVRLGMFPNITHAPALAAVEDGAFAAALGTGVRLETATFNAGPSAVEALFSDALDACFIGPNPAVNAYVKSRGKAVRVVAGCCSGGAALVVGPSIASAADLRGKKVGSPQLGNTQDVALRAWLAAQGLATDVRGGGDVSVVPSENAQNLELFRAGLLAGAWVPEPWVARMVREGGGRVLVDERTLHPGGRFVTTHLIVRTAFLEEHPAAVEGLLRGLVGTLRRFRADPAAAKRDANAALGRILGKPLAPGILDAAWGSLEFTWDPVPASLRESAAAAERLGFLSLAGIDLDGLYDLRILDRVLAAEGEKR